jgi:glutaredoxin-like protein
VRDVFQELQEPVHVLLFVSKDKNKCPYCDDTRQLLEEVVALSDKLQLTVFDLDEEPAVAKNYNVDKAPTLVIAAEGEDGPIDYGVRYAGIPSGHEFSSLIQDLIQVSKRDSGLSQPTRDFLAQLKEPVHLQIFVTPT